MELGGSSETVAGRGRSATFARLWWTQRPPDSQMTPAVSSVQAAIEPRIFAGNTGRCGVPEEPQRRGGLARISLKSPAVDQRQVRPMCPSLHSTALPAPTDI